MGKALDANRFDEYEWLNIAFLARERGFEYPRARQQTDRSYVFMSGLTVEQLHGLRDEIRAGGWTWLHTSRKRHYFQKPGDMFDNPSLCGKWSLRFYTRMDHDENDTTKCQKCLAAWKRMDIPQVFSPWIAGGWTRLPRGRSRHFFAMPGSTLRNPSLCGRTELNLALKLDQVHDHDKNCARCKAKWERISAPPVRSLWGKRQ